jgi:hypothetical protein
MKRRTETRGASQQLTTVTVAVPAASTNHRACNTAGRSGNRGRAPNNGLRSRTENYVRGVVTELAEEAPRILWS